jgi:hypothetical protein
VEHHLTGCESLSVANIEAGTLRKLVTVGHVTGQQLNSRARCESTFKSTQGVMEMVMEMVMVLK